MLSRESTSKPREETAHIRHMTEPAYVQAPPGSSRPHHLPHHLCHASKKKTLFFPFPRRDRNWDIGPLDVISGVGDLEESGLGVRTKFGVLGNLLRCCEGRVKVGNIPCEYCAVGVRNRRALPPECVVIVALRFTQNRHNWISHFLFHARLRIGHKIPTGHHNAYNASSSSFVHPDSLFPPHDTALS